jgi:hypothetical protein
MTHAARQPKVVITYWVKGIMTRADIAVPMVETARARPLFLMNQFETAVFAATKEKHGRTRPIPTPNKR